MELRLCLSREERFPHLRMQGYLCNKGTLCHTDVNKNLLVSLGVSAFRLVVSRWPQCVGEQITISPGTLHVKACSHTCTKNKDLRPHKSALHPYPKFLHYCTLRRLCSYLLFILIQRNRYAGATFKNFAHFFNIHKKLICKEYKIH